MSELNLNFDNGTKNITMDNTSLSNKLMLTPNEDYGIEFNKNKEDKSPFLKISDPIGIEYLAKETNLNSNENTPKENTPKENTPKTTNNEEEFSFFRSADKNKINETDDILINHNTQDGQSKEFKPIHRLSPQDIKNEKIDLLYKFKKLESQGIRTTMNYNMNSHLEDMRNEYIKLKKQREIDNSVKFQRKMLMACVTGLEFMNNRFDPFSVKLDGWSESVNENLNDYDEIFEELNEKYGGGAEMAPELRLLFTLAGSAFMFHLI